MIILQRYTFQKHLVNQGLIIHNEARQVKERIGKIGLIVSLEGLEKIVRIGKIAPLKKNGLIERIGPKETIDPERTVPTAMIRKSVSLQQQMALLKFTLKFPISNE
jgi:hypothetical protein